MYLYLFQKNIWPIMVFFFHLISKIGAQAHHQLTTKGRVSGMEDIGREEETNIIFSAFVTGPFSFYLVYFTSKDQKHKKTSY